MTSKVNYDRTRYKVQDCFIDAIHQSSPLSDENIINIGVIIEAKELELNK